ncbi:MAG: DUF6265 family protein, partial [Phycisphaerae bacterium]
MLNSTRSMRSVATRATAIAGVAAVALLGLTLPVGAQNAPANEPPKQAATTQPAASAAAVAPAAAAKIEDFSWLAGRWTGQLQNNRIEEIWSKPDGGMMMGMFRMVSSDNRTMIVEMMTLRQVGDTVEMSIRHFDDKLNGWEPIDDASKMRLAKNTPGEFDFVDPAPNLDKPKRGQPLRQIWRPSGDTLKFEVFAARNGKETK